MHKRKIFFRCHIVSISIIRNKNDRVLKATDLWIEKCDKKIYRKIHFSLFSTF